MTYQSLTPAASLAIHDLDASISVLRRVNSSSFTTDVGMNNVRSAIDQMKEQLQTLEREMR